jgi:pilus assembly protein Flp/PilA
MKTMSNAACTMGTLFHPVRMKTKKLIDFMTDESGQDLIEYALVAALIGLAAVTAMKGLSTKIGSAFTTIGTDLTANV